MNASMELIEHSENLHEFPRVDGVLLDVSGAITFLDCSEQSLPAPSWFAPRLIEILADITLAIMLP